MKKNKTWLCRVVQCGVMCSLVSIHRDPRRSRVNKYVNEYDEMPVIGVIFLRGCVSIKSCAASVLSQSLDHYSLKEP
jgi:hypothetical protein